MDRVLPKLLLVLFSALSGFAIFRAGFKGTELAFVGLIAGVVLSLIVLMFEDKAVRTRFYPVLGGSFGLLTGLAAAAIVSYPVIPKFLADANAQIIGFVFFFGLFGYVGWSIGIKKGEEFEAEKAKRESGETKPVFVIDTSILIDGRIADVCASGFIEGSFVIPRFVIEELHYIAESADQVKKVRGVRGIEMLEALQKDKAHDVRIVYEEMPDIKQVDMKLVGLAKKFNAKILTNDVNLTRVAKLHGVAVLSINVLAASLKPVVIPGEVLSIHLQKTGKEHGQAVGYIDDGTMVVVDHASQHIGKSVDVSVTSILQTTTGRMIFAKVAEPQRHITIAGDPR